MPENTGFARLTIQSQNTDTVCARSGCSGPACVAKIRLKIRSHPQIEIHFDGLTPTVSGAMLSEGASQRDATRGIQPFDVVPTSPE